MTPHELNSNTFGQIGCLLPPATIERIEEIAAREGLGKSAWMRKLVFQHFEALDASKATAA